MAEGGLRRRMVDRGKKIYETNDGVSCAAESISWKAFRRSDMSAETVGTVAGVNKDVPISGTHMAFNLH